MAQTITTTFQLRRDTTANWMALTVAPANGEPCWDTDKSMLKIGDGKTLYKDLPYVGGEKADHYVATRDKNAEGNYDVTELEAITAALNGATPKEDDVAIVKSQIDGTLYAHTAFIYGETATGFEWKAMDGNYDAENVYLNKNITLAGNYTRVGNLTKSSNNATATFSTKGKSIAAALTEMLSQRIQPGNPTQPNITITLTNAGAKEVGTKFTPAYTTSFSAGSYTYGPATGVTASNYDIDTVGRNTVHESTTEAPLTEETSTATAGSFTQFTVDEDTDYKVKVSISYSEGAIAKDNLGDPSSPVKKIAAGTDSATSSSVTGYRGWFYGYLAPSGKDENTDGIDDALIDVSKLSGTANETYATQKIRAFTMTNGSFPKTLTTTKMQQIFFAAPKGKVTSVSVKNSKNDAPQTITKITDVMVQGANGFAAIAYDVFYASNAGAESGTTEFTITKA